MRGHNIADLDPLCIGSADLDDTIPSELTLPHYSLGMVLVVVSSHQHMLRVAPRLRHWLGIGKTGMEEPAVCKVLGCTEIKTFSKVLSGCHGYFNSGNVNAREHISYLRFQHENARKA